MSNLSDAALPLAADVIDLIEAAHQRDTRAVATIARRAHREHGIDPLILLATITAGLAEQLADATGCDVDQLITDIRQRAAA